MIFSDKFNSVQRYKEFGDWIRSCYGSDGLIAYTSGNGTELSVSIPTGSTIDRIVIQEDQAFGQRIRKYCSFIQQQ